MGQLCRKSQDQEDHLDPKDPLVPLDLKGSRVTLVKMEKLAKLDLLVFLEILGILDPKEIREIEVKVSQDPVGHLVLPAHQDPPLALIDLRLWTWKALDLIWTVCGQCLVCLVHLVLLVPLVPLALHLQALVVLGHLVLLGKMGLQVSRDFRVYQVLMENKAYLVQKERRVMPVSWAFLDRWERRVPKVLLVPLAPLGLVGLLVFQDQLDLLDFQDHLVLLDQALMLVLMTWKVLVFTSVQYLE